MDQKPKWVYRRSNDADRLRTDEIETRLKFYQGLEEVLILSTGYEDPVNEKSSEESYHALAEDSGTSPTIESTVRTATDPSSGQLNEQSTASNIQSPALDCDEERSESITPNNVTGSNDWELADEFHAALGPELGVVRKQIRDVLQEYPVNEKSSEESYHALAEDSGLGTSPTIESTDRTATDPSREQVNEQSTASNIQSPALDFDEERSESITPNNVTGSNDWELADEFHAALGPELDVVREQIRDVLQEGVILFPLELISRLYLRFGRRLPQLYEGYSSAKLLAWLKVNSGLDLNNLILMPPMTIVLNKDNSSTGNQN